MRIFVTGATGFIGSAVVQELLSTGHEVLGLARSDASAESLKKSGAHVHQGDLKNFKSLEQGAKESEGVIHLGFIHDFTQYKENCELDRQVIHALASGLKGSNFPLIITSGIAIFPPGEIGTEQMDPLPSTQTPRSATEEAARVAADLGVRTSLVRLPPSVHGQGDHGFLPMLIALARQKGVSAFVDQGTNCWSAVHRKDAAQLFRLAFENAKTGHRYHGVAESPIPFKQIAEAIGEQLKLPVVSQNEEEAAEHFQAFKHFVTMDCQASSAITRSELNWNPVQIGLLEDLKTGDYFN